MKQRYTGRKFPYCSRSSAWFCDQAAAVVGQARPIRHVCQALIIGLGGLVAAACTTRPTELLNATLWQQRSVEYQVIAEQTYRQATQALEASLRNCSRRNPVSCPPVALEQQAWPGVELARLKPAVILDLDETALDNSRYHGELQRTKDDYSATTWRRWIEISASADEAERLGRLSVPGAAAFTQRAAQLGVDVFYITNRECPGEQTPQGCAVLRHTMEVMKREGFARADDVGAFLVASPGGVDKAVRRRQVASIPRRIVVIVGDDLGDFVSPSVRDALRQGRVIPESTHIDAQWGKTWFMLPNAMYGSWERDLSREAASRCAPSAALEWDASMRAACRRLKVDGKNALVRGFSKN